MRGSFDRSTRIGASPTDAWEKLHDVDLLASFSSHLGKVAVVEPGRAWTVSLQDRVGPLRLSAPMHVEIVGETPEEDVSIRAHGRDRGPGTSLVVEAVVRVRQRAKNRELLLEGTFELSGRVARLGAGVAKRQADRMIDEFWANLTMALQT